MAKSTVGEENVKFEPYRFCGQSAPSVLLAHPYNKYVRCNPNSVTQVSAHGGTSRFAQWKLHAMSNNILKLQNAQTAKFLRIISDGKTVDVGGNGGKFTLFRAIQHKTSNNMIQPHQISLESVQFPGHYLAVNSQCNVYSFNNKNNENKNDIALYLYTRPQPNHVYEQKEAQSLKPGTVVIEHALRQTLRVKPGNELAVNGAGGRGRFATWTLEVNEDNLIKFKSTKSGKYLRIINNGSVCNVGGGGGIYTLFTYDPIRKTLQSNKFPGFYLAVNRKSEVFAVHKASHDNGDYMYVFNIIHVNTAVKDNGNGGIVVVQHAFNKTLRVKPGNEGHINGNGGRGTFARWNIEYFDKKTKIKLKSTKSGKYLRIINDGSKVDVGGTGGAFTLFTYDDVHKTLESNRFPGYFLAVNKENNTVISVYGASAVNDMNISMKFDVIQINAKNSDKRQNGFIMEYSFDGLSGDGLVVVRSERNAKSLRVKPGDTAISNCLGGFGGYAQWKLMKHAGNIYKLQSTYSNKFIRISPKNNGSEVDVRGTGGKYTQFRVTHIGIRHLVVFKSVVFPKKYLASDHNGKVYVFDGENVNNKECMFKVWMKQRDYDGRKQGAMNCMDQTTLIRSQQQLIEQQKQFIDQLQKTVGAQQRIIDNFSNNGQIQYPVLQSNINDNGTQTQGGECDDFEYVNSPGHWKK